ncbi:FAD/NAD(P)-binding protein [Legionella worsleiensis]|uniref:FAD-dependent urate hydroxylase HpyO/Asp monooxygenase CreE-like FAD/NAD(P)-binding domain-containing protein n=1 Tax=Legionella worsleiensis TaxID=45076 RepID=A0A0W1AKC9_9GAMM|nr:FAD/NAD(P)-binding protein [Legionella worsleiensis]KTD81797.1 hypothetical protein Lwor_0100 [Legionella worsleiensis]STY31100.1 Uncharacterized protein conserved in bacteria [Legionella worsleiensis]
MKTLLIVGMGLSGNATFCQLVNHLISSEIIHESDTIIRVFETNKSLFATGVPYQVDCPEIWTLNNPARDFKFIPEVEDLTTWIKANIDIWKLKFPEINEDYVPRALVGMYLKAQYEIHKKKAKSHGIEVHEQFEEVIDVASIAEGTWQIHTKFGQYTADCLFLCFGHAPNYHFPHLFSKRNFFSSSMAVTAMEKIPVDADVYILGGQATFVDIALWLAYVRNHKGKIHTVTRNSPVITTKGNNEPCDTASLDELQMSLSKQFSNSLSFAEGKNLFWNAYKKAAKEPVDPDKQLSARDILEYQVSKFDKKPYLKPSLGNIDELRSFIKYFYFNGCYKELWEKLGDSEKTLFINLMYSQIMAYLTGITPLNARLLLELHNREMIKEQIGVTQVTYDESKQKFLLYFQSGEIIEAEYVIDASGFGYDISRCLDSSLLHNLVIKGFIVPKEHGGILINASSQVLNSRGEVQKNLFCIGPVASYGYQYPTPHASFLVFNTVDHAVNSII